jgi:hypothetical protein
MGRYSYRLKIIGLLCLLLALFSISCGKPKPNQKPPINPPSTPNDPTEEPLSIRGLTATILQHPNGISLAWSIESIELGEQETISYRIYRSISKTDRGLPIAETVGNYFADNLENNPDHPPQKDTPYFYRIICLKDGAEYGDSLPVFGLFSDETDPFEPNDWPVDARPLGEINKAYLFAFDDQADGCVIDTDWYVYYRENIEEKEIIMVTITFPIDSPFRGKAKLWFYDDEGFGDGNSLSDFENRCFYHFPAGAREVFFKIEPYQVNGDEGIGSYTIMVE